MTVKFTVEVSDPLGEKLKQIPDEEIDESLVQALETLAEEDERIQQQQKELHERMGLNPHEHETHSEDDLEKEMRRFLRGKRRTDPRLE